jgi:hypothetical protein
MKYSIEFHLPFVFTWQFKFGFACHSVYDYGLLLDIGSPLFRVLSEITIHMSDPNSKSSNTLSDGSLNDIYSRANRSVPKNVDQLIS